MGDRSFSFLLALCLVPSAVASQQPHVLPSISRTDFPHNFYFGTASAAYQYEGAAHQEGRGPSIWDTFSEIKGNIVDGQNGNLAVDEYHRYKEDIELMSSLGMNAYRFSISWSRIFPQGKGKVNEKGVAYYNQLINGLLHKGIVPFVTLYHWDLPQALHDSYGGWLNPLIIQDFTAYAETCFRAYGDRVKHWITFNEPTSFILEGYDTGYSPPTRCSSWIGNCTAGNSAIEPYVVGHHVLLSHAAAVQLYRTKYQKIQQGSIGISISAQWYVPLTNTSNDAAAAQRYFDFQQGWFLDPLIHGDYPKIMRKIVGSRLPAFTKREKTKIKNSLDFIGLNHYTSIYVFDASFDHRETSKIDFYQDSLVNTTGERDGTLIGPQAASSWLYIVPFGIYNIISYIRAKYNNPPIFITENGVDDFNDASLPCKQALCDQFRINFYQEYLLYVIQAIRDGADVRGFFAWTLLDNFEWQKGFTIRFGLHMVDPQTLNRYPKFSACWFKWWLIPEELNSIHDICSGPEYCY